MQIGISILLSFAVFKLRLSDDVPVQSDSIPLINVYFTLCISFSLASMIWFSVLNLIKSFLRTTMTNDRLSDLAIMKIENDIRVNYEEILNEYADLRNRRLTFF